MKSGVSIFFILGALFLTSLSATAEVPACGCVWDNTTKDYPANSKTVGMFSTTVRYSCGYLCSDGRGKVQHVTGEHQASYVSQEAGNEVVCEGLPYEAHENPTGSFNRWVLYMWNGKTLSFDARTSKSPTVREWAQNSCGSAARVTPGFVGPDEIDGLRVAVGMKEMRAPRPTAATVQELSADLKSECVPNEIQSAFLRGKIHESLSSTCSVAREGALLNELNSLRLQTFHLKSLEQSKAIIASLQKIVLCPQVLYVPTPAVMRITIEKLAAFTSKDEEATTELKSFVCSLGWRGFKKSQLPAGVLSK